MVAPIRGTWAPTDPVVSEYGSPDGDGLSDMSWTCMHQGRRYDPGIYDFRHREYDPELGRWVQQDPIGYGDDNNVYQFGLSSPIYGRDPLGLKVVIDEHDENNRGFGHNNAKAHFGYNYSFYETMLRALQMVIGDCAKLEMKYHYGREGYKYDKWGFRSNVAHLEWAELTYRNEKPGCLCNVCWQDLKTVIDSGKTYAIWGYEGQAAWSPRNSAVYRSGNEE